MMFELLRTLWWSLGRASSEDPRTRASFKESWGIFRNLPWCSSHRSTESTASPLGHLKLQLHRHYRRSGWALSPALIRCATSSTMYSSLQNLSFGQFECKEVSWSDGLIGIRPSWMLIQDSRPRAYAKLNFESLHFEQCLISIAYALCCFKQLVWVPIAIDVGTSSSVIHRYSHKQLPYLKELHYLVGMQLHLICGTSFGRYAGQIHCLAIEIVWHYHVRSKAAGLDGIRAFRCSSMKTFH